MSTAIIKRSITIAGHATSISLEEPFWLELKKIAKAKGQSVNALITDIDSGTSGNLSSAVRCFILEYYTRSKTTCAAT